MAYLFGKNYLKKSEVRKFWKILLFFKKREVKQSGQPAAGGENFLVFF